NGNGATVKTKAIEGRVTDPAPGLASEPVASRLQELDQSGDKQTDRYAIVVFSHLRWGFVWQRPQQFLSRFAKMHRILFVEEPFFDIPEGADERVDYHRVLSNVTYVTTTVQTFIAQYTNPTHNNRQSS